MGRFRAWAARRVVRERFLAPFGARRNGSSLTTARGIFVIELAIRITAGVERT